MLNLVLAAMAVTLWSGAYGWYFSREIRGAWRRFGTRRERRRQREAAAREAWARHLAQLRTPVRAAQTRGRPGPLFPAPFLPDDPASSRQPGPRPGAKILPFPPRGRRDPAP